jgi:hypothetical protein
MSPVLAPGRAPTEARGPFVRAAILCERVLCETDGTLSAIRILQDGPATGGDGRSIHLALLLMLVRGEVGAGQHRAVLQIRNPAGELVSTKQIALALDGGGPEQTSNLVLDVAFEPRTEGVYWFSVSWGDDQRLLTQVPFTARAAPVDLGGGQGDPGHAGR